eukprot:gene9092-10771_t
MSTHWQPDTSLCADGFNDWWIKFSLESEQMVDSFSFEQSGDWIHDVLTYSIFLCNPFPAYGVDPKFQNPEYGNMMPASPTIPATCTKLLKNCSSTVGDVNSTHQSCGGWGFANIGAHWGIHIKQLGGVYLQPPVASQPWIKMASAAGIPDSDAVITSIASGSVTVSCNVYFSPSATSDSASFVSLLSTSPASVFTQFSSTYGDISVSDIETSSVDRLYSPPPTPPPPPPPPSPPSPPLPNFALVQQPNASIANHLFHTGVDSTTCWSLTGPFLIHIASMEVQAISQQANLSWSLNSSQRDLRKDLAEAAGVAFDAVVLDQVGYRGAASISATVYFAHKDGSLDTSASDFASYLDATPLDAILASPGIADRGATLDLVQMTLIPPPSPPPTPPFPPPPGHAMANTVESVILFDGLAPRALDDPARRASFTRDYIAAMAAAAGVAATTEVEVVGIAAGSDVGTAVHSVTFFHSDLPPGTRLSFQHLLATAPADVFNSTAWAAYGEHTLRQGYSPPPPLKKVTGLEYDEYEAPEIADAVDGYIAVTVHGGDIDTCCVTGDSPLIITYTAVDAALNEAAVVKREVSVLQYCSLPSYVCEDMLGTVCAYCTEERDGTVKCVCLDTSLRVYADLEVDGYIPEEDTTPPMVTLLGDGELAVNEEGIILMIHVLSRGDYFVDPGVVAEDNVDGNLTASVSAFGASLVDTSLPTFGGEPYVIEYSVMDQAGNQADIRRRRVYVIDVCDWGPHGRVGTVFEISFIVYDDAVPAQEASVQRHITIISPCASGEQLCADYACSNVDCAMRDSVMTEAEEDGTPPIVSFRGPAVIRIRYGDAAAAAALTPCSSAMHNSDGEAACYADAVDESSGDVSSSLEVLQDRSMEDDCSGQPCRMIGLHECFPGVYRYAYVAKDAAGNEGSALLEVVVVEASTVAATTVMDVGSLNATEAEAQAVVLQDPGSAEAAAFRDGIAALANDGMSSAGERVLPSEVEVVGVAVSEVAGERAASSSGLSLVVNFTVAMAVTASTDCDRRRGLLEDPKSPLAARTEDMGSVLMDAAGDGRMSSFLGEAAREQSVSMPTEVAGLQGNVSANSLSPVVDELLGYRGVISEETDSLLRTSAELKSALRGVHAAVEQAGGDPVEFAVHTLNLWGATSRQEAHNIAALISSAEELLARFSMLSANQQVANSMLSDAEEAAKDLVEVYILKAQLLLKQLEDYMVDGFAGAQKRSAEDMFTTRCDGHPMTEAPMYHEYEFQVGDASEGQEAERDISPIHAADPTEDSASVEEEDWESPSRRKLLKRATSRTYERTYTTNYTVNADWRLGFGFQDAIGEYERKPTESQRRYLAIHRNRILG